MRNYKERTNELWKLKRGGELAKSQLRKRDIIVDDNLFRGKWGGVFIESKEGGNKGIMRDVGMKNGDVEPIQA